MKNTRKLKLKELLEKLEQTNGTNLFYAGEYVRDIVRRKSPTCTEIVVKNLSIRELLKFFARCGINAKADEANGVISINIGGKNALFSIPKKNGKPNVSASLKEDAKDRVYTIHAMYLPLDYKDRVKSLIDPYTGLNHLRRKTLSTVGKADAVIKADRSLLISTMALAAELGYRIDTGLFYAMKANAKLAERLAPEVVRDNLIRILLSAKPSRYIKLLKDVNLLSIILPELDMCDGVIQNKKYHKYDVFRHCLVACDNTPPDLTLRLAALFHDVGKPVTVKEIFKNGGPRVTFYDHEVVGAKLVRKLMHRLKFDDELISNVSELVYNHMYNYEPERWTDAAIKRLIKRFNITKESLDKLDEMPVFLLRQADRAASGLDLKKISPRQYDLEDRIRDMIKSEEELKTTDLAINGEDIMKLFGLRPGPTVGHILSYLLAKVQENPELNMKDKLVEEASEYLSSALK